ncbi:hypothetical protein HY78_03575 [Rhizorhabdus wittichii DC-6]|nr:hypothetical protein HY78_03575 [Rhizorhabdus wittichii DC-6]
MSLGKKIAIVGAGHNGLITAAYLAKAGLDVTVLEARDAVGGAAVTEELIAGYRMSTASFVVGLLRPEVIADLDLSRHGLELYMADEAISCTIYKDGSNFFMWRDLDRTLRDIKAKFGAADLEGFMEFGLHMQQVGALLGTTVMGPPPPLSAFATSFEQAGLQSLFERFIVGNVRDLVEHYFQSPQLRGHFTFPGIVSMYGGPSSAGTAYVVAHHSIGEFMGQFGQWGYARGGMGSITAAIARSAEAHGAHIRTRSPVARIVSANGNVRGVELSDGSTVDADIVISNADPKRTFLELVGERRLPRDFAAAIRDYDIRGSMARVYLVTDQLPAFIGFDSIRPGPEHEGHLFLGPSVELFEDGWDAQRRGRIPDDFALEVLIDTVRDASFAPAGKHVLILGVQQLPFDLAGTDWDREKERFTQRVIHKLLEYAPNLKGHILASACHTPLDWQRSYNLTGGNIYHGAMSLSRILGGRPAPLRNGYAAPIDGLYLCGAGTHPGGGVMGASGYNAAMAVLTDLGIETPRPWRTFAGATPPSQPLMTRAFGHPMLRRVIANVATSPLSRPIGRFLTRGKASS